MTSRSRAPKEVERVSESSASAPAPYRSLPPPSPYTPMGYDSFKTMQVIF
jgi:hypothetical protein